MKTFKFEIEYEFRADPGSEATPRIHWMYFATTAKTLTEGKDKAKKYYDMQIRSLGWGKYATLTEIRQPGRANDPPKSKTVDSSQLSNTRSKSSTSNTKRSTGTKSRSTTSAKRSNRKSSTKRKSS